MSQINSTSNIQQPTASSSCAAKHIPSKCPKMPKLRQLPIEDTKAEETHNFYNEIRENIKTFNTYMGIAKIEDIQECENFEQLRSELISWIWKCLDPSGDKKTKEHLLDQKRICMRVFERSTYLFDRYLATYDIKQEYYLLLGVTCMFVSIKYENFGFVHFDQLLKLTDRKFTEEEIKLMESMVLQAAKFKLNVLTATEISHFMLKEFNDHMLKTKSGFYFMESQIDEIANYNSNFILYLLKRFKGCYYSYVTMGACAIICSFEHTMIELKEKFVRWVFKQITAIDAQVLDCCREDMHLATMHMIECSQQRLLIHKLIVNGKIETLLKAKKKDNEN